jgi:NADH dehydrogenase [ubiquinone] 1 alpha subcomplex assembly factor 7
LHLDGLPLEEHSTSFFAPGGRTEADDDAALRPRSGIGPIAVSLEHLPAEAVTGVVIANELLDNLPFDLLERRDGRWWEVRIGLSEHGHDLTEVIVPFVAPSWLALLVPDPAEGARVPVQTGAASWVRRALEHVERGVVVCLDYASSSAELAARPPAEWLRTYRAHERGTAPLANVGEQDITCEVAVDQLARARPPVEVTTQAEWLVRHGIGQLVEAGRAAWTEGAARGDLAALRGRSRLREAEALVDPAGLGAFKVITWGAEPESPVQHWRNSRPTP